MEDLRQLCIWQHSNNQWFTYMQSFDETCVDYMDIEACGNQIMDDHGMDRLAIGNCITTSFVSSGKMTIDPEMDDNTILSKQLELYNA